MDFRKSFKVRSYKQIRNSEGDQNENSSEKLPILHQDPARRRNHRFWQQRTETTTGVDPTIVNRRSPEGSRSFDFTSQGRPSNNSGEIALDVEQEQDTAEEQSSQAATAAEVVPASERSSMARAPDKEQRARRSGINLEGWNPSSCSLSSSATTIRTNMMEQDEVVRCTSNMSSRRRSDLLSRAKPRSRLQDPPPQRDEDRRNSGWIGRSDQLPSGFLGKTSEEEEDDPLADEDVPEEYKNGKLDALTVLEWMSLVTIVAALGCSLSIQSWKKVTLWRLHLWKWEVFLLVLICGRLLSGWGIRIVVFFIERNFLLRKRVLYFVYGLRRGVRNCIWLGLVLLAWLFLFDKKVQRETKSKFLPYVTKILVCFLVGNFLWLIKTLVVKVLASSFHVSTYFDRIQEALFNQYVIETLSGPPMIEMSRIGEEEERAQEEMYKMQSAGANLPPELCAAAFPPEKNGAVTMANPKVSPMMANPKVSPMMANPKVSPMMANPKVSPMISKAGSDNGITIDHLHRMNNKNVSAWNMKRLMKIVRKASLTTLDEQAIDNSYEDEYSKQIRTEKEAKAAARKIFKNVAQRGAKHIYLEDLMRFLREDESLKTMSLFEGGPETKRISKTALKNWLVNAFRERRALALTLNDTKTAVNKLHQMVKILAAIVISVIWLILLEIASSRFLLFLGSQVVLSAFMFGNTAKTIFESIIFLFIVHPYDVGDRCEIDGIQMVVEEMNILTTLFLKDDKLKVLYPNSVLWQRSISNYYRSPEMGDAVEFCVHIATPAEKIAAIRQRISNYIDSNPEHWCPSAMIIVKDMENLTMVRIAIWPSHKINHQDMGEKFKRRGALVEELIKILVELDIQYRLHPLDINVRTMPTVVSNRVPPDWSQNPA
ncbi:PREDICTED: mechanosensitive ion channel protein 8-like [Tarenaya hassleriana]|uniref:mechanosensitive ion channel protein 8-like n=1 Tax=Tarenaya hassleriana TaxID=28532 RepID=UPI0008FD587F|nr:PREDICTED: mechanosensitive ion channel protein 8-like [Tarenaya hassleriana]